MGVTRIRGKSGELQWGYHRAATVRDWTALRGEHGWHLTGTLADHNTFALSQRPLVFTCVTARGVWVWPVEELLNTGASLSATLGPKEH